MLGLPRSLWKLNWFQLRAMFRRVVRQAKTPRGAVLTIVAVGLLSLWIGPSILFALFQQSPAPEFVRPAVSLVLFVLLLMQITFPDASRLLAMTPPEVQFLVAGPYSRRDILGYKLTRNFSGSLLMALPFSLFGLRYVSS